MLILFFRKKLYLINKENIIFFEVGILDDDLGCGHSVRNEVHDQRHRDTHTADAGLSTQRIGVKRDSIESEHWDLHHKYTHRD